MFLFGKKDPWPAVVEKASVSVVMLVINSVRSWDGNPPMCNLASGFIVDKKLGLILTCRSNITTGPITGKAVFLNNEETNIAPVYVDPEHDFGFLKFDPATIKYMPLQELQLHPQGARVGLEIRVLGSDAGEKLMVLGGTISDCQRMAPNLNDSDSGGVYTDVNIFYMTSSSGTSEGSAGAPVLDSHGRVVALNCGGSLEAASSFFLPLNRVTRALALLRKDLNAKIPRGTIQTIFVFTPMDEVRRLELPAAEEEKLRKASKGQMEADGMGALVVARANIGGPGDAAGLKTGDVLVRIDHKPIVTFLALEEILDNCLEQNQSFELEYYRGPNLSTCTLKPEDMSMLTLPKEFLEYSGGIVHPLGFQLSFLTEVPLNSVYVSSPGYSFSKGGIAPDSIIVAVGERPIANLSDLENALCEFHDGEKVPVRYFQVGRKHVLLHSIITIDRKWFRMVVGKRDSSVLPGWSFRECPIPRTGAPDARRPSLVAQRQVSFKHLDGVFTDETDTKSKKNDALRSLVWIEFSTPYRIDGIEGTKYAGCGVVLDATRGLVWCDRCTAISMLGDIKMIVASTFEVDCKVFFLHPLQNFAILQYDPTMLGNGGTDLKALELFAPSEGEADLRRGDVLDFVGFTGQRHYHLVSGMKVTGIERANLPTPDTPVFNAKNFDRIEFDQKVTSASVVGGIYIDSLGRGRCFLSCFGYGASIFMNTLTAPVKFSLDRCQETLTREYENDRLVPSNLHCLGIEFGLVQLSEARQTFGLTEEWAKLISKAADDDVSGAGHGTREVLRVANTLAGTEMDELLLNGDLLLAADGKPMVSYSGFDAAASDAGDNNRLLDLTVCRDKEVFTLSVKPIALNCTGTDRIVNFAGVQCQFAHDHVRFHGFVPDFVSESKHGMYNGVYISSISRGSPAETFGVSPVRWLAEINSVPIRSLTQLLETIAGFKHGEFIRILTIGLTADISVTTLELDFHFWPTTDLSYNYTLNKWTLTTVGSNRPKFETKLTLT